MTWTQSFYCLFVFYKLSSSKKLINIISNLGFTSLFLQQRLWDTSSIVWLQTFSTGTIKFSLLLLYRNVTQWWMSFTVFGDTMLLGNILNTCWCPAFFLFFFNCPAMSCNLLRNCPAISYKMSCIVLQCPAISFKKYCGHHATKHTTVHSDWYNQYGLLCISQTII